MSAGDSNGGPGQAGLCAPAACLGASGSSSRHCSSDNELALGPPGGAHRRCISWLCRLIRGPLVEHAGDGGCGGGQGKVNYFTTTYYL